MKFRLVITRRAILDRDACFEFIHQANADAALRWLNAFDDAVRAISFAPHSGFAPEAKDLDEEIRQKLFKTRHGRPYRILFLIRGKLIYILHVRGPGQNLMTPEEIAVPGEPGDQ